MRELCLLSASLNTNLKKIINFQSKTIFSLNDLHLIENIIWFGKQILHLIRFSDGEYKLFVIYLAIKQWNLFK